jgi:hypothetical protein
MRRLAVMLAVAAFAGCGSDDEQPAAGPDTPVSSGSVEPNAPAAPAASPRTCKRLGRKLVGASLRTATARAERRGCALRVAVLDGEPQVLTEDFSPTRINVRVRAGVVAGVEFMG